MDYIIYLKENNDYASATLNVFTASFRLLFDVVLSRPLSKRQLPSLILPETETIIFSHDQIQLLLDQANYKMKTIVARIFILNICLFIFTILNEVNLEWLNLFKNTLTALRTYWLRHAPDRNYLSPSIRGDGHMKPCSINSNFHKYFNECGIYDKAYQFRCLCHPYAKLKTKIKYSAFG